MSRRNDLAAAAIESNLIFLRLVGAQQASAIAQAFAVADAIIALSPVADASAQQAQAAAVVALCDFVRNGPILDVATIAARTVAIATAFVAAEMSPTQPAGGSLFRFNAAASLTTAVPQNVPPGALLCSSANLGLGLLAGDPYTISKMRIRFMGDAANVAGQTITCSIAIDGVLLAATLAGIPTTAGTKVAAQTLGAPFTTGAEGEVVSVQILPSAALTAAITNVMVTLS